MTAILAVVKRLFASNAVSFLVTAFVVLCATTSGGSEIALSNGNYTWLLAIIAPFFAVFYDFGKLIHLGTSKKDYLIGSFTSYGLLALGISLANTGIHSLLDPLNRTQRVINMMDLCGWTDNGLLIAFFQQTAFLLLAMVFLHVLLSVQPHWYGWLTDGALAAILCIFTPIAPLRHLLAGFFNAILLNRNPLLHIGFCLFLCTLLSLIGVAVLKRKNL